MSKTQTDLSELLERVRSATGPDWQIDRAICVELNELVAPYTASIDAALALVERCLPGWVIDHMGQDATGIAGAMNIHGWTVEICDGVCDPIYQGQAPTLPLAILSALLQALGEKP